MQLIKNAPDKGWKIFTHKDLDGAVSLLTFLWSFPNESVSYTEVTNVQIGIIKDYIQKTCNPPNILIMDLALRSEFVPDLDYNFITYIDHHKRSDVYIKNFKQSRIIHKEISSNAILIRKLFKEDAPEFTDAQKKLILLADDHDSGDNKFQESYDLNILFWTQFKNEFCYFCNYYKNGFKPFTEKQKEIIKYARDDAKMKLDQTDCYIGDLIIEGIPQKVLAATTENFNNIVIDSLMNKYQPNILFYINTKTEKVSMRQRKTDSAIDLSAFADKYCEGNGHMYAAGGKVTPLFMEMTKKLKPL